MRNDIPIIPRINKNNIIIDLRSTSEKMTYTFEIFI